MYFPNFISFNLILLPDAFLFAVCCIVNNACWHQWICFGGFCFTWNWKTYPLLPPTAELVSEKFRKVYSGRLERIASRNSSASWECFRTEIKWLMGKNFSPVSPVPLPSFSPRPFRLSSIIKNNKTPTNLIKTSHKSQKEEQVEEWAERRGTEGQERSRSKTVI